MFGTNEPEFLRQKYSRFYNNSSELDFLFCSKALNELRMLVAGAGSNCRPWGYEYYFNICMQYLPKNKQPLSAGNSRLSRT
jgi:hypothetical protein